MWPFNTSCKTTACSGILERTDCDKNKHVWSSWTQFERDMVSRAPKAYFAKRFQSRHCLNCNKEEIEEIL